MKNIRAKVKEDILILKIDLSKKGTPSKSGYSTILAQTSKFETIEGTDLGLLLTLTKKNTKKTKKKNDDK